MGSEHADGHRQTGGVRPVEMLPIECCNICVKLDQVLELDYEKDALRPSELGMLRVVASSTVSESREAWDSTSTLECQDCGTIYRSVRSTDEGHSFMDPTHDNESVQRLSLGVAEDVLGNIDEADAAATLAALAARGAGVGGGLALLLSEQRAPSWQLQKYAIECVMDSVMAGVDPELLETTLLGHPDPVVRVAAVFDLLHVATASHPYPAERWFTRAQKVAAGALVAEGRLMQVLAGVLAEPAQKTLYFNTDSESFAPINTHRRAALALRMAAQLGLSVDDAIVDRLFAMLSTDEGGRFEAAWALVFVVQATPERAPALRARLERLPKSFTSTPMLSFLAKAVREQP